MEYNLTMAPRSKRPTSGFTLIELLVVIAIISLLSSIVLASISQARVKAQAVKTAQELRQVELSLRLWANDLKMTKWWTSYSGVVGDTWDCDRNFNGYAVSLTAIKSACLEFKNYLSSNPTPPATNGEYEYRNAADTNDGLGNMRHDPYDEDECGTNNAERGVMIRIDGMSVLDNQDYGEALDKIFDGNRNDSGDSKKTCGRLRYSGYRPNPQDPDGQGGSIYYHLGNDTSDFF